MVAMARASKKFSHTTDDGEEVEEFYMGGELHRCLLRQHETRPTRLLDVVCRAGDWIQRMTM